MCRPISVCTFFVLYEFSKFFDKKSLLVSIVGAIHESPEKIHTSGAFVNAPYNRSQWYKFLRNLWYTFGVKYCFAMWYVALRQRERFVYFQVAILVSIMPSPWRGRWVAKQLGWGVKFRRNLCIIHLHIFPFMSLFHPFSYLTNDCEGDRRCFDYIPPCSIPLNMIRAFASLV